MENRSKAEHSTKTVNKITYAIEHSADDLCVNNSAVTLQRTICTDAVIVEQPLQITLSWCENGVAKNKIFSITMRTPGQDKFLIIGLLHSEGIIKNFADVESISSELHDTSAEDGQNEWLIEFSPGFTPNLASLERYQMTYSSCGLCGATSLKALQLKTQVNLSSSKHKKAISVNSLLLLSNKMRAQQKLFDLTGGVHGAALFDQRVTLLHSYEDIGRHNAVDKVVGAYLSLQNAKQTSARECEAKVSTDSDNPNSLLVAKDPSLLLLLVSGRISFEIVQKTIMAGISILVGVGAPSDLAIQAAKQFDITLIGFNSAKGFNVYHGDWRLNNG